MNHLYRVEKWARVVQWITAIALVAIAVAIIAGLLRTPITPAALDMALEIYTVSPDTTQGHVYLALAIMLSPPVIMMYTLNTMRPMLSGVLSLAHPAGERSFSVNLNGEMFFFTRWAISSS